MAIEESASIDWARLMRGTSSMLNKVTCSAMAVASAEGSVERAQKSDDNRAGFQQGLVRCTGRVDHRNQIGLAENGGAVAGDRGAGGRIGFVGRSGRFACAGFDRRL